MEVRQKLNRRRFLQSLALAASGAMLAACAPKVVKETVIVEKEVEKVVEKEVVKKDMWTTGLVSSDIDCTFHIMGWEGEDEARKFLLHMNRFWGNYYPNVKMEFEWGIPWGEYWTKLPIVMAAGTPPDMCWQHCSRSQVFPAKGWLLPLDDYIEIAPPDGWPDDWWPTAYHPYIWKGKQTAIPYDWCPQLFYVNRTIMDQFIDYPGDFNWTIDDFVEAAIKATSEGPQGPIFGATYNFAGEGVWRTAMTMGGDVYNEDITKSLWTSDIVMQAAQWVYDLRWKHKASPSPADFEAMGLGGEMSFASGRVAMHQAINDITFRLDELIGGKFDWGVYPFFKGPGGRFAYGGNSAWAIPTDSKQPDLAYELIRYCLSNPDLLPTTGVMGSAFVGRKSFHKWGCPTGELGERIFNYKQVTYDAPLENETHFAWYAGLQEWFPIWDKWMEPIFVEGKPGLEEAMQGMHKETQELLDTGWWRD